jgi:peptide/nickel transport system substrate-binding protein
MSPTRVRTGVIGAITASLLVMSCAPGAPPASNSGTQKPAAETGSASSGGAPSNAAPAAQPAATVAGEPKYGGRFSVQVVDDPFDWDPTDRGKSLPNQWGLSLAYESLVGFKNGPGVSFEAAQLEPELAERWEVSPDSSVFTFFLQKGVKFANIAPVNGRELTSADVKWSYEYFSRTGEFKDKGLQKAQYDWMFENLKSVDVVDPYTVKVTFSEPFAPFLYYAGSPFIPIMPHEIYDQDSHFHDKIVGTGPFQLDLGASQKGSRWSFKKNPTYWQPGKPYIDEVQWLVIRDDAAANAAFQAKQLDWQGDNMTTTDAESFRKANPQAEMIEYVRVAPIHLYMNTRKAPLDDVRVRKAISLGIDRDEFVKVFTAGKGGWALAGAFPDTFSKEEIHQMLRYDPAESKKILADAGFPNGIEIEYMYTPKSLGEQHVQEMELLQSQLKKVGINLNVKPFEYADLSNRRRAGDFTMNHTAKAIEGDVDSYLWTWHPTSRSNYAGVNDPALNALLEGQRRESDPAKRREIVRQAVKMVNEDHVYGLALYSGVDFEFTQPWVKNYYPNFLFFGWPVLNSWIEK